MRECEYRKITIENKMELLIFLKKSDSLFPIPLSHKQDLEVLSDKLLTSGVVVAAYHKDQLVGVACGYANNMENKTAYLSVLCVSLEFQGKSIAQNLVHMFIAECKKSGMKELFLYTHTTNKRAIALYKKLGFEEIASDRDGDIKLCISLVEE